MATEVATAYVGLVPSASGFGSALSRQAGPQVNKSGALMGAGLGKSLLKGFIAIGIATKIASFLSDSVSEARESIKIMATTEAIIKSTGGAAKISADQVGKMASRLSALTGIDDEAIQTGENLLLTFKNVTNFVDGQFTGTFDRATAASLDLSVAGFGSIDSAAKMLGKALNDPVKGLTALGRAGVTFTEQQQDQIKALVKTGDLLGAQSIILKEVESQVGGVAEATATSSAKASVAFGNLKEQIGTALIPAIDSLATTFTTRIAPAISTFITNLQSGKGSAGALGNFIRDVLVPNLRTFGDYVMTKVVPAIRDELIPAIGRGRDAFNDIRDSVKKNEPQLRQLFNAFKKVADFILTKFIPTQIKMASIIIPIVSGMVRIIVNWIGIWIDTYNDVRGAIKRVEGALSHLQGVAIKVAAGIQAKFKALPALLKAYGVQMAIGLARGLLSGAGAIDAAVDSLVSRIPAKIRALMGISSPSKVTYLLGLDIGEGLARGVEASEKNVTKKTKELVDKIKEQLNTLRSDFSGLVDPIKDAFTGDLFQAETAQDFVNSLLGTKGTLTGLTAAFKTLIKQGLNPKFLYGLFQSGNAGLILDLAKNPALAAQAGGLFGDVNQLSTDLGQAVAGATPEGKAVLSKMDRLEHKLDKILDATKKVGSDVGDRVNGAASSGRRRAA